MMGQNKDESRKLIAAIALLAAAGAVTLVLAATGRLTFLWRELWEIFATREHLRTYVESWGTWAPAVFIGLQSLQVVIAPIPGELTGAVGGFIFGLWPGVIYSTVGLGIGSILAFLAARVVGLPLVKLVVSQEFMEKFHFLVERRGIIISLIFFTVPGFPKDVLSYLLGLSPMGFLSFALVATLGRIPGTVMLSCSGCAVYDEDWTLLIALSILCAVVLGFLFLMRDRIELWVRSRNSRTLPEQQTEGGTLASSGSSESTR
jgi:uncharacterized membrane protein YdjX (TVP38/TMEM64 family)